MERSTFLMRGAFVGARPPFLIACAIAPTGASATSSQSGKRLRRSAYARSRFVSFVFCERIVRTSSSSGGSRRGAGGVP
jgi:hypothetical protein